jgi:hypothetical protein
MTAITARRENRAANVVLLDGAKKPGAKILVSGGSRCNVTNRVVSERDFWGGRATVVRRVLRAFTADAAAAFFHDLGVLLHEEADGKLFPDSSRSRDVLNALLRESEKLGVVLLADHRVLDVARADGRLRVSTAQTEFQASAVVLATGGQSLPKTGSDGFGYVLAQRLGHSIVTTTPALAPLVLDESTSNHRDLAGVSVDVGLAVWVDGTIETRLQGPLLWTHVGASGPVAMNASRHWLRAHDAGKRVAITINFCGSRSFEQVEAEMIAASSATPRASVHTLVSRFVPDSVARSILSGLALDPATLLAHLTRSDRRTIAHALVESPLDVVGTRGYNFAEATAGGVSLDEVDPATMESRICPGLYVVGEILDVDGRIGGFNFQWAWSSGFVAGRALARRAAHK